MPSSLLTYRYRIKDATSGKHLLHMASAVNFVWNYCNEISMLAAHRDKRWLSAFDLIKLIAGTSKDLGIHTDTQSEICREYATRRKQHKAFRLAWRSKKRSLGWIPFKGRCVRVNDGYGHLLWADVSLLDVAAAWRRHEDGQLYPGCPGALVRQLPV